MDGVFGVLVVDGRLWLMRWWMRNVVEDVGVVVGSYKRGAFWAFSKKNRLTTMEHGFERMPTDNTDYENARKRCPDCRTREGSQSVRIRFIRCIRVQISV